jgi:hypothetical protein
LPVLKTRSKSDFFLSRSSLVRLFLIGDGELLSPFSSPPFQDETAAFCLHACTKAVLSIPLDSAGLIGPFHRISLYTKHSILKYKIPGYASSLFYIPYCHRPAVQAYEYPSPGYAYTSGMKHRSNSIGKPSVRRDWQVYKHSCRSVNLGESVERERNAFFFPYDDCSCINRNLLLSGFAAGQGEI